MPRHVPLYVFPARCSAAKRTAGFADADALQSARYYEEQNSYLSEVLRRRQGIPITLSILYAAVARRLPFPGGATYVVKPVSLPMTFHLMCARQGSDEEPLYIDVFSRGALKTREEVEHWLRAHGQYPHARYFEACGSREVWARMLRNLENILQQQLARLLPRVRMARSPSEGDLTDIQRLKHSLARVMVQRQLAEPTLELRRDIFGKVLNLKLERLGPLQAGSAQAGAPTSRVAEDRMQGCAACAWLGHELRRQQLSRASALTSSDAEAVEFRMRCEGFLAAMKAELFP